MLVWGFDRAHSCVSPRCPLRRSRLSWSPFRPLRRRSATWPSGVASVRVRGSSVVPSTSRHAAANLDRRRRPRRVSAGQL